MMEATMAEEVMLIPSLLGRSGAVVCIGFENTSQHEAAATNVSLQCSARSKPPLDQTMLFGVPLAILGQQRSIRVGITIFEIAIQGYSLADPVAPLARRNFEHIFRMIRTRIPRIANRISDSEASRAFAEAAVGFAQELIALPYNDSDECAERFGKFDAQLTHEFNVQWLLKGGKPVSKHFNLNSKTVAWWLSNHVIGTEHSLI
jgi:hypothetical protein